MNKLLLSLCMVGAVASGTGLGLARNAVEEAEPVCTSDPSGRGMIPRDYRPGEVIVKLRSESSATVKKVNGKSRAVGSKSLEEIFTKYGVSESAQLMPLSGNRVAMKKARAYNGQYVADNDMSKLYCLSLSAAKSNDVMAMVEDLKALPEVEYAEPNYIVHATVLPADTYTAEPLYSQQWGPTAIGLDKLWNEPITGVAHPVIAILDTGVDIEHPDLKDNIWTNWNEKNGSEGADDDNNGFADDVHGYDFVNQSSRMRDNNGHGTHCAGIAAATGTNGVGITGANPDALIMPVTVMQSDGTGDIATIIKGIDYAVANGAEIISMSFGGYSDSLAEREALAKAYQKAVLVAAAGNDGRCIYPHMCPVNDKMGSPLFPAAYNFVLGVQASRNDEGKLASFSNFDDDGPIMTLTGERDLFNYELTAPGTTVMSTFPGGQYRNLNGTSMACPLVAGAISRLLQCKEYSSKEELFGDLIHSANGNVNIYGAFGIKDEDRQPTLSMVTYRLDDEKMGDGDGRPDAGETIRIYPTFRNDWGNARNITYTVSLAETEDPEIIEFMDTDPVHVVSDLSSYATAESEAPFLIKINPNCVDGRRICLTLNATCDNISEPLKQDIVLEVENGVEIGGVIAEDMTLTADKNYIVTKTIAIPQNVTLTIEPGTTLKFRDNTGIVVANGKSLCNDVPIKEGDYVNTIRFYDYPTAGKLVALGKPGIMIILTGDQGAENCEIDLGYNSEISYCKIEKFSHSILSLSRAQYSDFEISKIREMAINKSLDLWFYGNGSMKNCLITNNLDCHIGIGRVQECENNKLYNSYYNNGAGFLSIIDSKNSNYINNKPDSWQPNNIMINSVDYCNNMFSNYHYSADYSLILYSVGAYSEEPKKITHDKPSYYGSGKPSIIRSNILDINNGFGYAELDISNALTRPVAEAHGIVWKVKVNGYDAQNEYELLPPLGVGRHEFKVYFNRPMNKAKEPMIAMGVRPPYTQTSISGGSWNEAGDIYTAYLDIQGRDNYDGVNTIYVSGAEDDEFFPIPVEDVRFHVNVQSAGSMSTGFEAVPGLGKVDLLWENPEEHVTDLLGYNLYRYTLDSEGEPTDTIRINPSLLSEEEFTDFDVVPGTTYCYYYKVMTTALTENSPSKVVAVTPLTSTKGDANGSMDVDVADIVTEVSYMLGQDPKPFIFEAADVNSDTEIDVLDVVGTVNIISATPAPSASTASSAVYSIEDGVLYVESLSEIAGVQVRLWGVTDPENVTPLQDLEGFETMGTPQDEEGYLFLAFSLSGKTLPAGRHALLRIGNAGLSELKLSDKNGRKILAVSGNVTGIGSVEAMQMGDVYPVPFVDVLNVPVIIGKEGLHNVELTISTLSGAEILKAERSLEYGEHVLQLNASTLGKGFYLLGLKVDGRLMQTRKVIKR